MRPMLATKGTHVPRGDEWVHEVKWDGVRALTEVRDGRRADVQPQRQRRHRRLARARTSPLGERDLLVDGEVIALNEHGLPDFRMLQDRMHMRNAQRPRGSRAAVPATYMVFDLLRLDGEDLTAAAVGGAPRAPRGARARRHAGRCRRRTTTAPMLFEATRQQGLEGVVSKRRCSTLPLRPAHGLWLKFAHRSTPRSWSAAGGRRRARRRQPGRRCSWAS